eukprot:CAMPEP_0172370716 /NCGR_PEP_ID=MMETSP1060-20121228/39217_1 /TAXON_ID=37318 /ORGANISM="Pseudo-nitzschia pungens, Strain cf. cingulata" /LENGTH=955 /DNA_ID=CAMNT_0013096073 /DNA_START=204 /DNA_END=3071 /DNA_ORIENTATION=+
MSDCCIMVHHEMRSRSEVRTKRSREQSSANSGPRLAVGIEITSVLKTNTRDTSAGEDKMEVESCPKHPANGKRSSKPSYNETYTDITSHKEVTDESGESEDTEKGKFANDGCSSEGNSDTRRPQHEENVEQGSSNEQQQVHNNANEVKVCEQESITKQPGTASGDDQQSSESNIQSLTLPQHERIQHVEPLDINYRSTPASLKLREVLISRLGLIAPTGRIQVIDLSRRGLLQSDAELISSTLRNNPQIAVLKVGYNNFGDGGANVIASGCAKEGRHHQNLTVLDLGFNGIGDDGCTALSLHMVAGNHTLRNLFLSGNNIKQKGAVALASAILHGCSLSRLHLSNNNLGEEGIRVLVQSIAEAEKRVQQLLHRQGGIKLGYNIKPVTIEECSLDNVSMTSKCFETLSNMVVTNFNIKNISLANNNLTDSDLGLLSQSLAQNKNIPLKSLILSFNKITCVGVECLMNAVWGSSTLKEIKLDSNLMQDRGAQLCSVVLGSIRLELLDVSFNRISTVGIKAIMKSLSENDSLKRLALSGVPMDQNASKAVSYALAYNQSLQRFNIDSCSVGYSGQRHIVAGIVSNRYTKLQRLTGFPLAPIIMTLGLPQLPEEWGNDRVLSFVRFMWTHWKSTKTVELTKEVDEAEDISRGPAPPSMVAASAKRAFGSLSKSEESRIAFQNELQNQIDDNPIIFPDTSILVRSLSGNNLQVPLWEEQWKEVREIEERDPDAESIEERWSSEMESLDQSSYTGSSSVSFQNITAMEYERRNMNLTWLRSHLPTLTDIGNLAFNDADLWQLHQYYFSPAYNGDENTELDTTENTHDREEKGSAEDAQASSESEKFNIGRSQSFRALGSAGAETDSPVQRPNKRSSLGEELKFDQGNAKRAKNSRPRIAYYPRVKERLESKPSSKTLCLLRQLKYIENAMLEGRNIYSYRDQEEDEFPTTSDVEMVLLDLL